MHSLILRLIFLKRWGRSSASYKEVEDLYQRGSDYHNQKEEDQRLGYLRLFYPLGRFAYRHLTPLGDILVEFIIAIANVAWKSLNIIMAKERNGGQRTTNNEQRTKEMDGQVSKYTVARK